MKTANLTMRIDPKLKRDSMAILNEIGISTSQAVTMLLKQIVETKSIPFELKIPNKTTLRAMKDAEEGRNLSKAYHTTEEFMASLDEDD